MLIFPEGENKVVPEYLLRDDPEHQLSVLKKLVEKKVENGLKLGVEPSELDVEFLGD